MICYSDNIISQTVSLCLYHTTAEHKYCNKSLGCNAAKTIVISLLYCASNALPTGAPKCFLDRLHGVLKLRLQRIHWSCSGIVRYADCPTILRIAYIVQRRQRHFKDKAQV
jgi:hypothetical protein